MRKKSLVISLICFVVCVLSVAYVFADITLTAPLEKQAKEDVIVLKINNVSEDVVNQIISVRLRYYMAGDLSTEYFADCEIRDNDYENVVNDLIVGATDDGKKKRALWYKKLQNKCKNILNITGAEN